MLDYANSVITPTDHIRLRLTDPTDATHTQVVDFNLSDADPGQTYYPCTVVLSGTLTQATLDNVISTATDGTTVCFGANTAMILTQTSAAGPNNKSIFADIAHDMIFIGQELHRATFVNSDNTGFSGDLYYFNTHANTRIYHMDFVNSAKTYSGMAYMSRNVSKPGYTVVMGYMSFQSSTSATTVSCEKDAQFYLDHSSFISKGSSFYYYGEGDAANIRCLAEITSSALYAGTDDAAINVTGGYVHIADSAVLGKYSAAALSLGCAASQGGTFLLERNAITANTLGAFVQKGGAGAWACVATFDGNLFKKYLGAGATNTEAFNFGGNPTVNSTSNDNTYCNVTSTPHWTGANAAAGSPTHAGTFSNSANWSTIPTCP